jgi:hypothetical protein
VTHVPLRNEADPQWRAMHLAADQEMPGFTRLWWLAFQALVARSVLLRLRSALRFGNVEGAMAAVPVIDLLTLRPAVEEILARVAMDGAKIGKAAEFVVRLGPGSIASADVAFWARQQSAKLVVGVTDQTRMAIRRAIVETIQAGMNPARAAKLIEASIGLNGVQVTALLNRADELRQAGKTAEQINARLERYAAQLRRQRAGVIARHELMQAANEGRRLQWEREVRDGLIAPDRWEREWVAIVPSDGRTCPYCEEQDGQRAPISGAYPDGSDGPPGHVMCRCTEVLRRVA